MSQNMPMFPPDNQTKPLHTLLKVVGAGGLMGVTTATSTTVRAFEQLGGFDHSLPPSQRHRLIAALRRQQLIVETKENDQLRIQLTVKGIHRLQRMELETLVVTPQQKWDGRWRMVVFDIPQSHKNQRYIFIAQLRRLGFCMVRQSTWYHAYPCFEIVDELVRYCALSPFVSTAEIIRLDSSTTQRLLRAFPNLT